MTTNTYKMEQQMIDAMAKYHKTATSYYESGVFDDDIEQAVSAYHDYLTTKQAISVYLCASHATFQVKSGFMDPKEVEVIFQPPSKGPFTSEISLIPTSEESLREFLKRRFT